LFRARLPGLPFSCLTTVGFGFLPRICQLRFFAGKIFPTLDDLA